MKKRLLIFVITFLSFLPGTAIFAQAFTAGDNITLNVSEYALIDTNHAPVSLTLSASDAGAPVAGDSNSDLYVKISSIVPGATDREITARVSAGTIPAGTTLTLVSAPCTTANSGGDLGTVITTPITLSSVDQFLVMYIGTCYTGTGYNDGYQMTFDWTPDVSSANYGSIESITSSITVVFTLTAHDGN